MMSEHRASIHWKRETPDFAFETYNRAHHWNVGETRVPASAAPEFRGDESRVDPERAFVASISACHMLTFLAIAAKKRFTVDAYTDDAVGIMEKNTDGKLAITKVTLRPKVTFGGSNTPSDAERAKLHESAHRNCFIANSALTTVTVDEQEALAR
jgi:organic hydroperoxide reductase OsmC/OhrA